MTGEVVVVWFVVVLGVVVIGPVEFVITYVVVVQFTLLFGEGVTGSV